MGLSKAEWQIWVDTGGTFTDAIGVDPTGRWHRAKVLSTSAVRGRVGERVDERSFSLQLPFSTCDELFRGFTVRRLEGEELGRVESFAAEGNIVHLEQPSPSEMVSGEALELASSEEAPILAARLLTSTASGASLPVISLRLATTRGTNALLESKGAKTALLLTQGFGDLLAIGTQQRPDLFALEVVKPPVLASQIHEVSERLSADGTVLVPLDEAAIEALGKELVAREVEAVAVAFLHSYKNPEHENRAAAALKRAGVAFVSTSAALAPAIKIVPRAQTALVDAYLAPILRRYLSRVTSAVEKGSLHVMTSAGGLVSAASFQPKDSLLSGPAGGVVGAARAARRAGFGRVIAFDMGGTSTDVARWDGDFDYVFEHRVGAGQLLAPALAIESVAAGGGSICELRDGQLKVGPESAGARPGPACYGAGGPLTVTDVNLLLGRLAAGALEIPLDLEAARAAAAATLAPIASAGDDATFEGLLEGWLEIADERMADAIRSLSVARGYDPAEFALLAFGGAGGQHACAVAAQLGMSTVLVPPDAGLLSALGLGAAVLERFRSRQVLAPLADVAQTISELFAVLEADASAAVEAEGIPPQEIEIRRRQVELRLSGQESCLSVAWRPELDLVAAFAAEYGAVYGYPPPGGRSIEVESLHVIASSRRESWAPEGEAPPPLRAEPQSVGRARFGGVWHRLGVFRREQLPAGASFAAPALVLERHSTTVVPPGWMARVDGVGSLVLEVRD